MMVEEFDVCHKFSEKIKREIIPHEQRENCEFTHNVSCSEFNINYLIAKICEEAKTSDLFSYGWKSPLFYFNNLVNPWKAKQVESLSIARSVCYLSIEINGHNLHYHGHCFRCRSAVFCCRSCLRENIQKF